LIDENPELVNFIVGAAVAVGGAVLIIATCGTGAIALGAAIGWYAGGLYTTCKAIEQDRELGESRSPWEMFKTVWNGSQTGARIGVTMALSLTVPGFQTTGASVGLSMFNGTQMRSLQVGWDRTLTNQQKRAYVYDSHQIAKDGASAFLFNKLFGSVLPKAVKDAARPIGSGGLNIGPGGEAVIRTGAQSFVESLVSVVEDALAAVTVATPVLAPAVAGIGGNPPSSQSSPTVAASSSSSTGGLNEGLGTYADQGGHHPMAKKAFEGVEGYDPNQAISISKEQLSNMNVSHPAITGQQNKLYTEFANTGKTLTMDAMKEIEIQALVNAGVPTDYATNAVNKAVSELLGAGITSPVKIPWN